MTRAIAFVFLALTTPTLFGQFDFSSGPTLPDRVDPQTRIAQLEAENESLRAQLRAMPAPKEADYLPSFTWPGYDGPEPFKALAQHMRNGEAIHSPTNVDGWSPFKLAFTHDQEHFAEYAREGRPLPNVRDPRLAEWLKTMPKVATPVRKIVMETWRSGCSWCDKWLREDKPKAERDGFIVEVVYVTTGSVPRFRICDGDRCSQYQGYIQFERLKAMVRR